MTVHELECDMGEDCTCGANDPPTDKPLHEYLDMEAYDVVSGEHHRAEVQRLRDVLDKGRRFERAYQESLGATWTLPQKERLDSLQSAFLDAYLEVLR